MTKPDDDNDNGRGYTLGDLLGAALIGATAAAVGVGVLLLRERPAPARAPEKPARPPAPPFEVEDLAGDDDEHAGDDVPRVDCN